MLGSPRNRMLDGSNARPLYRLHSSIIYALATLLTVLVIADNLRHNGGTALMGSKSQKRDVQFHQSLDISDIKLQHQSGKHMDKQVLSQQSMTFTPVAGVDKVKVEIYLESQDRATQVLTEWVFVPVVGSTDVDKILDIKLYAWGNSRLLDQDNHVLSADVNIEAVLKKGTPKFLCEHGPSECEGNAWISCLQDQYPDIHQWFRVFTCMETLSCSDVQAPVKDSIVGTGTAAKLPCKGTPGEVVNECIQEYAPGMDLNVLQQCVSGDRGSRLLLENMQKTAALDPRMDHVPWIVVDGKVINSPNRTDAFLLGKRICDSYVEKVKKLGKLGTSNISTAIPEGCLFFPDAPPYFDVTDPGNQVGITILWIVGGALFGISVTLLACWKYHSSQET